MRFSRFLALLYFLLLVKLLLVRGVPSFVAGQFHHFGASSVKVGYEKANFIPLKTIYYYLSLQEDAKTGVQNIGGNILLFIPLGLLLPFSLARMNFRKTLLTVTVISLCFELLQLLFAVGSFDVDDIILNAVGGALGYLFFLLIRSIYRNTSGKEKISR